MKLFYATLLALMLYGSGQTAMKEDTLTLQQIWKSGGQLTWTMGDLPLVELLITGTG